MIPNYCHLLYYEGVWNCFFRDVWIDPLLFAEICISTNRDSVIMDLFYLYEETPYNPLLLYKKFICIYHLVYSKCSYRPKSDLLIIFIVIMKKNMPKLKPMIYDKSSFPYEHTTAPVSILTFLRSKIRILLLQMALLVGSV